MDNHMCQVCFIQESDTCKLHVHHLTYDHVGYEDTANDLVSLCETCHKIAHEIERLPFKYRRNTDDVSCSEFLCNLFGDAKQVAPYIYDTIKNIHGANFNNLLMLRQPENIAYDGRTGFLAWGNLYGIVRALAGRRYHSKMGALENTIYPVYGFICNRCIYIDTIIKHCQDLVFDDANALINQAGAATTKAGKPKFSAQQAANLLNADIKTISRIREKRTKRHLKPSEVEMLYICAIAEAGLGHYPPDILSDFLDDDTINYIKACADFRHKCADLLKR